MATTRIMPLHIGKTGWILRTIGPRITSSKWPVEGCLWVLETTNSAPTPV